mmetsp:Transcript_3657/g.8165  ORF Transcript_3657/g.8165 Transcript_3657/m.8165 type:complete len:387 (-) Transcript_3657:50-1210(-)
MEVTEAEYESPNVNPMVELVEIDNRRFPTDFLYPPNCSHNTPLHNQTTAYLSKRRLAVSTWGFQEVQAARAHQLGIRGQGVKICIIDSGLDMSHNEFSGNRFSGFSLNSELIWNQDESGHGTHIAGIITASDTNGLGINGIVPDADIFVVRVFDANERFVFSSGLLNAAYECAVVGAKIINMALAGRDFKENKRRGFELLSQQGIIMVASAGNFGPTAPPKYPASYDNVISVVATDEQRFSADFSEANRFVDVCALGVNILSAGPFDSYEELSGTSQSSAFVSGVLGLLWSFKPDATADEIRNALFQGCVDLGADGRDIFYGHGLVQTMNSLEILNGGPLDSVPTPPSTTNPTLMLTPKPTPQPTHNPSQHQVPQQLQAPPSTTTI